MSFTSFNFVFLVLSLIFLYYLIPGRLQWPFLLIASIGFYSFAGYEYLLFLGFTSASVYLTSAEIGRRLQQMHTYLRQSSLSRDEKKQYKQTEKKRCRILLSCCILLNLGILFYCKACLIAPVSQILAQGRLSFLALGLPLGISFYMFQSIGYIADVYNEKIQPERNFFKFLLFVSYFPQLIQGPISRHSDLAPALYAPHKADGKQISFGLQRMVWGYFKKLVIADRIAVAAAALRAPDLSGQGYALLCLFYGIQLYADFSGGIDITMGISQSLGIPLPENFLRPYFSKSTAEFWRRWHITLGLWMKDYVFYPLFASDSLRNLSSLVRKKHPVLGKKLRSYLATLAAWLATGIWHGLSTNFMLWGLLNGLVIIGSEALTPVYDKFHGRFHLDQKKWYSGFQILRTFLLMLVIQSCDLFPDAAAFFRGFLTLFTSAAWCVPMGSLNLTLLDWGILTLSIIILFTVSTLQEKHSVRELLWNRNPLLRYSLSFFLLLSVILAGYYGIGYDASNFIYNHF